VGHCSEFRIGLQFHSTPSCQKWGCDDSDHSATITPAVK